MTYLEPRQPWDDHQPENLPVPSGHYPPPPVPPPPPPVFVAVVPQKSAGAAVALELVLGLFGVFGVGNLYAGRAAVGILLMLSFWGLFWVNVLLVFLAIGFVTMPLTWIAYLVAGPLLAARGVERHNAQALLG
jgi:TM2 domain-containing membrane protein YozV